MPDIEFLKNNNPETTAIIQQRLIESKDAGKKLRIRQKWIRFSNIPQLLKRLNRFSKIIS